MGWESDNRGNARYVQKKRVDGKVVSRYFTGEAAHIAANLDFARREKIKSLRATGRGEDQLADQRISALQQVINQSHVNQGFVRRNYRWHFIPNVTKPLTAEEQSEIDHIKSISSPCTLSACSTQKSQY